MFSPLLYVLVATSSVIATTIHRRHHASSSDACSTGSMQCCENTAAADSPEGSAILTLFGVTQQGVTGLIGFNCNPITFEGATGDTSCQQSPVCCEDNSVGGFFSMGCTPVFL
ncbi:hypothetical protein GSI_10693 [Ganoderma sinense ZZ0214-1]|uniref:Hydrophobin n=1 Tax=Ganoderma sinense ZZ0214-1 TaxID=1077348 RepID=A0A2G8S196_9APHY|nr:hypothetical protein GSI_10693 [Ganoderma sinense ZZ0214-1]